MLIKTSHEHHLLPCSDCIWKVAKFLNVRDKALSDAFLYIVTLIYPPIPLCVNVIHQKMSIPLLGKGCLCIGDRRTRPTSILYLWSKRLLRVGCKYKKDVLTKKEIMKLFLEFFFKIL